MGDDIMDIHASQSDESLMGRSVAQTFVSGPCGEHEDLMTSLSPELPWSKDSTCLSQIHHIHVPARMRCLSGRHYEEYHDNASAWL
ncbi:hypothetical protein TNCV_178031 [Trichonephila clavipes]|nr:hypothetical protein TNCV_178031 [Trichonephila clavipes]